MKRTWPVCHTSRSEIAGDDPHQLLGYHTKLRRRPGATGQGDVDRVPTTFDRRCCLVAASELPGGHVGTVTDAGQLPQRALELDLTGLGLVVAVLGVVVENGRDRGALVADVLADLAADSVLLDLDLAAEDGAYLGRSGEPADVERASGDVARRLGDRPSPTNLSRNRRKGWSKRTNLSP